MAVTLDTGLTSRAIIGRFYRRLEEAAQSAWWTKLAMRFSSTQESETYRWLGMVPQVREWKGGRQVRPLRAAGVTIVNKVWETTVRVDADELRRDRTGQIMIRVNEMARRVALHPNKLLSDLINNGNLNVGYDGVPFFSSGHTEGVSGTQSNTILHDVLNPAIPTAQEMYDAIVKGIAQILGFRDDQGEPIADGARSFLVMVPTGYLPQTLVALSSKTIAASDNPLANRETFAVEWVSNPRITLSDRVFVFRTDGEARPFIFQEELPVQMQVLAEGSELEVNENQHQYGVKAVHEAGYGFWQDACQVVLT